MSETRVPPFSPLEDRYGRRHTYVRISVTDRCNLRCIYCMPPEGIVRRSREEILRFDEIVRLAGVLARMGVAKLRITGGEPLVRRDLPELIRMLAAVEGIEQIGMTTNGLLLREHAARLRSAGLTGLNVSLDTLRPERFERITLRPNHCEALDGIEAALEAGFSPLKLNVVVMEGVNDDELLDFAELARERPFRVRFIEFMSFRGNGWAPGRFVPWERMRSILESRHGLVPVGGPDGQVSKEFRIEGFAGTVGFITPVSDHFCGGCNRLRVMADGTMKPCLFSPDALSLRDLLRGGGTDEEIARRIREAVGGKRPRPYPESMPPSSDGGSMVEIGG